MKEILTIVGPTAVGKTAVGIKLAQKLDAEVICVDSLLVYKDFNIGTAKPTELERGGVFHHLIDIVGPADLFTAGDFCRAAERVMMRLQEEKRNFILVGGSGLYLKALERGMFKIPQIPVEIKHHLERRLKEEGAAVLFEELKHIDSESAESIHPHDHYRIIRALEVCEGTGEKFSVFKKRHDKNQKWNFKIVGLDLKRSDLHEKIKIRTEQMIEKGLINEIKALRQKYPLTCKPFKSIGYKEGLDYLDGKLTLEELREQITQHTRALARRQLTWFRGLPHIQWMNPQESKDVL